MILTNFLDRLKQEYYTLDGLSQENYYARLSGLFVLLELDGERLNVEQDLNIDQLLERFANINEEELRTDLSANELALIKLKVKAGLAILINTIEG
ncbi:hypothetical protein FFF34_006295 [Inquilinus sp. KBS0705]|nr:hypothetical protein FFF34_006295 [Inquilinus sp. KBS0705]